MVKSTSGEIILQAITAIVGHKILGVYQNQDRLI